MGSEKKIVFIFSLVILSTVALLRSSFLYTTIVDDAYIFFRFAENISAGNGFVWNIGEPVVEGYSSFLYLILIVSGCIISIDPEVFSIIAGIVSSSIHLYISYLIYQHFYPSLKKENIFTVTIILLSPPYLYWCAAGMDTAFYSMFLLISIYCLLILPNTDKSVLFKGVLFGILCLARYEAILYFLLAVLYLIYKKDSATKLKISKSSLLFCLGFLIIFVPYFLWRWNYFGYFLPNTFYAKTGGGIEQIIGGFFYSVRSFRLFYGLFWIVIFLVLTQFSLKMIPGKARFIFSFSIISIIATIFLGGDHFSYGRFFIPVLPLLFIIFPPALKKFLDLKIFAKIKKNYRIAFLFVVFVSIMFFKLPYQQLISGAENLISGEKDIVVVYGSSIEEEIIEWQHGYALMGHALKEIALQNESIAAIPVGIIGYKSKMNVLDMVGVVDPVIAHQDFDPDYLKQWIPGHNKGDGNYILSKRPDYIQLIDYITSKSQRVPNQRSLQFKSIREIWNSPIFHKNYKYLSIQVADGWFYNLYKRID